MADYEAADLRRQRLDPLLERIALVGEREFGALGVAGPWRSPRRSTGLLATPMISPRLPCIRP
jgi:hypothetical protein